MRYYVIGPDGSRYGPVDVPMLQQWFLEGRILAETVLEVEGSRQQMPASAVLQIGPSPVSSVVPPPQQAPSPYAGQVFTNLSGQGPNAMVPPEIRGWSWAAFLGNWIWAIAHRKWLGLLAVAPYIRAVIDLSLSADHHLKALSQFPFPNPEHLLASAIFHNGQWLADHCNLIWAVAHTWIGLLDVVPYVGLVMVFVLGAKGNEWAWQNRRWDSVEHFKTVQLIWTRWGVVLWLISVVLGVIFGSSTGPGFARTTYDSFLR